jgi:hypothetical protein
VIDNVTRQKIKRKKKGREKATETMGEKNRERDSWG